MPHKDPEVRKAYHRAWHYAHRDEALARMKREYQRDKDKRRVSSKRWYDEHPTAAKQYRLNRRLRYPWRHLLKIASERAIKKGVPFSLTEEWAAARWTGRCELTDIEFLPNGLGSGPKPFSPSIDRINPKMGYTPNNCRFILACVNSFKHEGTDKQMFVVARALISFHRTKKRRPLSQLPASLKLALYNRC
jgi:hypothetical protein